MSWTNICIVEREKNNRNCRKQVLWQCSDAENIWKFEKICGAEFYQNLAKKNDRSDDSSGCW